MKYLLIYFLLSGFYVSGQSLHIDSIITIESLNHTVSALSHDSMKGRFTFSKGADYSAVFIAKRFQDAGLHPVAGFDGYISHYPIRIEGKSIMAKNVVGALKGASPDTIVIFSAHYDHIGFMDKPGETGTDSIFNGANDNASGVAALIEVAKYYKRKNDNRYTLIFIAFSGEELGLYGSKDFAGKLDKRKVHALINFDMLGRPASTSSNHAMIIGKNADKIIRLLNKQLQNDVFFERDKFPAYDLTNRTDHASFAKFKNSFSIICTPPKDPYYHQVTDEIQTIDFEYLKQVTTNIARACIVFIN